MSNRSGLIRSLVGIRGVCSALIVALHLAPFAGALTPVTATAWSAFERHGYIALDFFFVLSGFVIAAGYRAVFAHWPGWGTFGRFLWARLSRFYPVHLVVLAVMVAAVVGGRLVGVEVPHGGDLGVDLLRQVTLTSGWGGADKLSWNGPAWSLSAEWFSYLLLPVVMPALVRLRTPAACVAVFVLGCALPLVVYSVIGFGDDMITYRMPLPRAFGGFVAGAALQALTLVGRDGRAGRSSRIPALVGRATGALAVLLVAAVVGLSLASASSLFALPLVGLVILGLSQERGLLDRVLASRAGLVGGELSVTVFLSHVPFLLAASRVVTPERFPGAWGWLGLGLLVVGVLVLGQVLLVAVERPAQSLMRRMVSRPARAPATPADVRTETVASGTG